MRDGQARKAWCIYSLTFDKRSMLTSGLDFTNSRMHVSLFRMSKKVGKLCLPWEPLLVVGWYFLIDDLSHMLKKKN